MRESIIVGDVKSLGILLCDNTLSSIRIMPYDVDVINWLLLRPHSSVHNVRIVTLSEADVRQNLCYVAWKGKT